MTTTKAPRIETSCDVYSCRAAAIVSWKRSVAELAALAGQTRNAVSAERHVCARHTPAIVLLPVAA